MGSGKKDGIKEEYMHTEWNLNRAVTNFLIHENWSVVIGKLLKTRYLIINVTWKWHLERIPASARLNFFLYSTFKSVINAIYIIFSHLIATPSAKHTLLSLLLDKLTTLAYYKNWGKNSWTTFFSTCYVKALGKLFQRDGKFMHNRASSKSHGNVPSRWYSFFLGEYVS